MVRNILIGLALIIAILVCVIGLQPSTYRVERSTTIAAPSSVVFAQVNDFHKWQAWSPWAKLDPAMKQSYEGPAAGPGAVYSWAGNKDVGEGRMTITDSHPSDWVKIRLEFLRPFAATSNTEFTFVPQGNQTTVKWVMVGDKDFIAKAFHLVMNMDKMIGSDFEKGLAQMKALSEAAPK